MSSVLGSAYFIGLSQPHFEFISRESASDPISSTRLLVGTIERFALFPNAFAGSISVASVDHDFIGEHEKEGYFVIDFAREKVSSGLTKEGAITELKARFVPESQEIVFEPFDRFNHKITHGRYGHFSCPER